MKMLQYSLIQLRLLRRGQLIGRVEDGGVIARLKLMDKICMELRYVCEWNEYRWKFLLWLLERTRLDLHPELVMDLSHTKELETKPTYDASQSREEASAAASASDGQGDDKERGDLQAVEAYGSPPGKEKVDLQAAKDSSPTAEKGKGKHIGYEAQQKKNSIEDVKSSSQQEISKPKKKKQKKRQRRKMDESTENLSCHSGSPSSSHDGTSTSTIEGEPKPSSGDLAKISREHKQEQESMEDLEDLLGMDEDTISNKVSYYFHQLYVQDHLDDDDDDDDWLECDGPQQLTELHEQLAFYRIIGYELSNGRKLDELDIAKLKEKYPPSILYEKGYFQYYEDSLEWYFDPERFQPAALDNYQRLVLCDNGLYMDWDQYHSNYSTYESDLAYVKFCDELAHKTKWFQDYLVLIAVEDKITMGQWDKVKNTVYLQAMKIALRIRVVSLMQVMTAFQEYIWSMRFDCCNYKDFDGVYFEVWKRVAKQKMEFTDALSELYREDMFPLRNVDIKDELRSTRGRFRSMKENYDLYVACIDETVPEKEARQLIKDAIIEMAEDQSQEPRRSLHNTAQGRQ
uniref:Uncharacterized protein n=1 Tax=Oryza meridionalis TaxID=40149 RepID=A0A0E0CD48_9ORYZ